MTRSDALTDEQTDRGVFMMRRDDVRPEKLVERFSFVVVLFLAFEHSSSRNCIK